MTLLGILSALILLSAFAASEWGYVDTEDIRYDAANFIASVGLFLYAISLHAWPFVLTNLVWGLVSGVDVWHYCYPRVDAFLKASPHARALRRLKKPRE